MPGARISLFAGGQPAVERRQRLDTARSGEIETPVEDLDPERFVSVEAGVRLSGERLSGELAARAAWWIDRFVF